MVDPQVWQEIPHGKVRPAEVLAYPEQGGAGEHQAKVTEEDERGVLGLVQRAGRVEMVDTAEYTVLLALPTALRLALVAVVAGDVGDQVHGPAEQLLQDHMDCGLDGRLLHQLVQLVRDIAEARGEDLSCLGDENHVPLQVAGGLVVFAVRDFPGEVRHQQRGVAEPAHRVVQQSVRREGLVSALMGHDP